LAVVWAAGFLLMRRRVEVFMLAGSARFQSQIARKGDDALREWIQRRAESS
jgi:hypothetical protein